MAVTLNTKYLNGFVREHEYEDIKPQVELACEMIDKKNGPGSWPV